jgi:hypothetical protein
MASPHIILFADANFQGAYKHVSETTAALSDFNDALSSFIILGGIWKFFENVNFDSLTGPADGLGPGFYSWVGNVSMSNDTVSSLQLVAQA